MGAEEQAMFVAQQEMEFRVELFNRYACVQCVASQVVTGDHHANSHRMALSCFKKCVDSK